MLIGRRWGVVWARTWLMGAEVGRAAEDALVEVGDGLCLEKEKKEDLWDAGGWGWGPEWRLVEVKSGMRGCWARVGGEKPGCDHCDWGAAVAMPGCVDFLVSLRMMGGYPGL